MSLFMMGAIGAGIIALAVAIFVITAAAFRQVVPTNDVHIVQSVKKTTSYGKDQDAGNVYYRWPAWMPIIGVKTIVLPVSVFNVTLDGYAAYDKGRVPFEIDVMAFFRITETNMAAQRVHSNVELIEQLKGILQGACRAILASSEIEEILEGRGKFGEMFTKEVDENLKAWGVQTVKCIELMDIRDAQGSKVIENIMAKKKSLIERQSRIEVAENIRAAQEAEIQAQRAVEMQKQDALEQVGKRTADKDKQIGISNEQAQQDIKTQKALTASKEMDVQKITAVRTAEIQRDVQVIDADRVKKTDIIKAEGDKQKTVITAEGRLEQQKLAAQGIEAEGKAKGAAEQAVLMAPVNSQIALANEIGGNAGYQTYLIQIRTIEKEQFVGVEQAKALSAAQIKVIANSGDVTSGVQNVMDLFTTKGGTQLAGMVEAFAQTPAGGALIKRVTGPATVVAPKPTK